MIEFKDVSFGATSAVITGLAVIAGLSGTENAITTIITALLIIAVADNISDSFGIHVHQECQKESAKDVRRTTIFNFITRLVIVAIFILLMVILPMTFAVILSTIFGLTIITVLSYFIAKEQKINPTVAIIRHLLLAIAVMIASFLLREAMVNLIATYAG
jgi:vacuolar iron transporter family protein